MKKGYLLLAALITLASCTRRNSEVTPPAGLTSGTWKVSLFSERGDDDTNDFAGYVFSFAQDGAATATKSGTSKAGTWSLRNSSTRFNIDFGAKTDSNKPLGELTDDWKVISISSNEIKLTDDNPSSAEFLTFTKN